MRTVEFRFVVIRNGADFGELRAVDRGSVQLRMNSEDSIKTGLSGSFLDPGSDYNMLTDQIRPEMIIDGVIHHLGVFLPASVRPIKDTTGSHIQIEAYDRGWIVRDSRLENLLHLDAGTSYHQAIEARLAESGIALVSAVESVATLPEDREWNVGTSRLDIVNELLAEINYNPLWFDQEGMAILEPVSVPVAANIEHTLDSDDVKSLLVPTMQREVDIYNAPNVFIAVCSNPDKTGVIRAVSVNTNPQSPLSIGRRGRRICQVITVDNIADQDELQALADRARNDSMITGEQISLTTGLLPGYGVDDVVGIHYDDLFSIAIDRAWTMDLRPGGLMQHTLEKVVVNLG